MMSENGDRKWMMTDNGLWQTMVDDRQSMMTDNGSWQTMDDDR